MALRLSRFILAELLRVMLLTAAVLVTVIAFGAAIKPLANDDLLSAAQTVKYIALAIVPMLQFALPFAAGFAATLVLHRMTTDNEITAAAVSGLSYPRLLLPIAALGAMLAIVMLLLTQSLIPRFWGLMKQTLARDVTTLFQSSIDRGAPFVLGDLQIYADDLEIVANPPDTHAETRFILTGVVAAELGPDGEIVTDVAARQAVADVHRHGRQRLLKMVLSDTVAFNARTGELLTSARIIPRRPIPILDEFEEDPLFMTRKELLHLRAHPDDFDAVEKAREELAGVVREVEAWEFINEQLAAQGSLELHAGDGRVYQLRADRIDLGVLSRENNAPIEINEFDAGAAARRFRAVKMELRRTRGSPLDDLTFDLSMRDVTIEAFQTGVINEAEARALAQLRLPTLPAHRLDERLASDLLEQARPLSPRSPEVNGAVMGLTSKLQELQYEISARLLKRYALCATAPLLLLLGAVLAMWLRDSLPLTIYLWAFLPSILDLLLLSSGEQMMKDGRLAVGAAVMWSGNALLAALLVAAYLRMSRH